MCNVNYLYHFCLEVLPYEEHCRKTMVYSLTRHTFIPLHPVFSTAQQPLAGWLGLLDMDNTVELFPTQHGRRAHYTKFH
jgi:hypothetical protein